MYTKGNYNAQKDEQDEAVSCGCGCLARVSFLNDVFWSGDDPCTCVSLHNQVFVNSNNVSVCLIFKTQLSPLGWTALKKTKTKHHQHQDALNSGT